MKPFLHPGLAAVNHRQFHLPVDVSAKTLLQELFFLQNPSVILPKNLRISHLFSSFQEHFFILCCVVVFLLCCCTGFAASSGYATRFDDLATISATTDQAAELLQKLSLDPLKKPLQDAETAKKSSAAQYTPADMAAQANGLNKPAPFERTTSALPDFMDTSMFYNPGDILHQPTIMEVIMDLRAMIGIGIQVVTGLICLK